LILILQHNSLAFSLVVIVYAMYIVHFTMCVHFRINHLDDRLNNFQQLIDEKFPKSSPTILSMDIINMYIGKKRHYRLYQSSHPKMWNFTGTNIFLPSAKLLDYFWTHDKNTSFKMSESLQSHPPNTNATPYKTALLFKWNLKIQYST